MSINIALVCGRVSDELGLTAEDLIRLYGISATDLDQQLNSLGGATQPVFDRIMSDVDALRVGYRQIQISNSHIAALQQILANYHFHPFIPITMANGRAGWRLSGDDAQYIAYRAADLVNMDFEGSDILRKRLNRLVFWPQEARPEIGTNIMNRLVDITTYLVELTALF